jgi:hypothetical protein
VKHYWVITIKRCFLISTKNQFLWAIKINNKLILLNQRRNVKRCIKIQLYQHCFFYEWLNRPSKIYRRNIKIFIFLPVISWFDIHLCVWAIYPWSIKICVYNIIEYYFYQSIIAYFGNKSWANLASFWLGFYNILKRRI